MNYPARLSLGHFPTPIEKLERLSRHLGGPTLYVKRDDQSGLATGGNKARKLEFLFADALAQHCEHVVTLGGPQSNHARQTAAGAARLGLGCSLVLRGDPPVQRLGNLLLDELLGAKTHWAGARTREEVVAEVMTYLQQSGARPYLIPLGGSNGLGALGYAAAMEEAIDQLAAMNVAINVMVIASSSAGTQAGLVLGAAVRKFSGRVLGISIDSMEEELKARVTELAVQAGRIVEANVEAAQLRIEVNADYLGGGYSVVGDLERDAIRTVARTEGLLLDPVYTGRAMGGLIDLIRRGTFAKNQNILFWHTGGTAALSAFADKL
ncbi:MAG TPA: D-cysteine desulfhydrase family protein [Chthoniobacteraceae bacterium]|nr:D-cysteine desulfhydrase family protein [Chthoniobacteraceae bacterium]